MRHLLIMIMCFTSLFSSTLTTTENVPDSIVEGIVSVISGDVYLSEKDIEIQGAQPIILRRNYISQKGDGCWSFAEHLYAMRLNAYVEVREPNGSLVEYVYNPDIKEKNVAHFKTLESLHSSLGLTNTAKGVLSGRTNLKNNTLTLVQSKKGQILTVHGGDGTKRIYQEMHGQSPLVLNKKKVIRKYLLISEQLSNGNHICYEWDKDNLLKSIRSTDPSQSIHYAHAYIKQYDHVHKKDGVKYLKKHDFDIETSDHSFVKYKFLQDGKHPHTARHLVNLILTPNYPDETLQYDIGVKHRQAILTEVRLPEGRKVKIEYYGPGKNSVAGELIKIKDCCNPLCSRVKSLHAPVGTDDTLYVTHSFLYDIDNHLTTVVDSEGSKTKYRWNDEYRLTEIRRNFNNNSTYASETYAWGKGKDATNLVCKTIKDGTDQALLATHYTYDTYGNVEHETLYGNLSGLSQNPKMDSEGMPIETSTECYKKNYQYSSDGKNLLIKSEEQNGLVKLFTYHPNTDLITSELTLDRNQIILRKFYTYDEHHVLIREVEDDGSSADPSDITHVIQRKIKIITPRTADPFRGLPQTIEERYCTNGQEIPLRKTVLEYNTRGCISKKEIYDAQNKFRYSLHYRYDEKNRLVEESNPIGQVAKTQYDAIGNKTSYQEFGSKLITHYFYDKSNRLIKTVENGPEVNNRETLYFYDLKSRLTKTINYLGQETLLYYDALGNLIETHEPPYHLNAPTCVTRSSYDSVGRVISKTNGNGFTTLTSFNAYDDPVCVTYPDGTVEKNVYNPDGTTKIEINAEGTETHYTYDVLKRPLTKQIISNGQTLSLDTFSYHGNLLLCHTNPDGITTHYSYDGAGRKIRQEKASEKIEYIYDALGRVSQTREGERIKIQEYDLLDRVIEERDEDIQGSLYSIVKKSYDNSGNLKCINRSIQGETSEEHFIYDCHNRLIRKIDPLGQITEYLYKEDKIETKITIDPLKNITEEVFNHYRKAVSKTRKEPSGKVTLVESMAYDSCGNLIAQTANYVSDNGSSKTIRWEWSYDCRNWLIELREGAHTSTPRLTSYQYTPLGDLKRLHMPSNVIIETMYDPLGRKIAEVSSDGTMHLTFSYNGQGELTSAHDYIQNHQIEREVDPLGRILSETFDGKYQVTSTYDSLGRRTSLALPDKKSILYHYDPYYLRQIIYKNQTQNLEHQFTEYDLDGNLLFERSAFNTVIQNSYDRLGRHIAIDSHIFKQTIQEFDPAGNVLALNTNHITRNFAYDSFYHLTNEEGDVSNSYSYNPLGSRTKKDTETYELDDFFQYLHLAYDQNGNPTQNEDQLYKHDAFGRLLSIETPLYIAKYTYDALHRRRTKKLYCKDSKGNWSLSSDLVFIYDDFNEIGEMSPGGTIQAFRILGRTQTSEAGSAVAIELDGQLLIPYHDLFGNIVTLTNREGVVVEQTNYSAFGVQQRSSSLHKPNPWLFASKRYDEESQLILFGRRYYNPHLGQWLTPDPAGFTDHLNLYLFVHNNPLAHTDLYGYITDNLAFIKPNWSNELPQMRAFPNRENYPPFPQYNFEPAGLHTLDFGNPHPDLGFGFSNGIRTTLPEALHSTFVFSDWTGRHNFDLQYNPTRGFFPDVIKCGLGLFTPASTNAMAPIRHSFDRFFDKNPSGRYFEICTSAGCIHLKRVLEAYPIERRSRITVLAIAPAAYIDRHLCENVLHLISERDSYVKLFAEMGMNKELKNRNNPNVRWLPVHPEAPETDHSVLSPTVRNHSRQFLDKFIELHGGNK